MLERWKKALDNRKIAGTLLTDLSKAFECLNHELLITKLEAYGFHHSALTYIFSYLSDRKDAFILIKWFNDNYLKLNEDKCKLLITKHNDNVSAKIGSEIITASESVKLLGIIIDNKLNFNEYISKLCKKVSQKIHALARISNFMSTEKLRKIMKAFIDSQFGYCPVIWMFCSRTLNNRINQLHE